jgi:hypothetical protein
VSRTSEPVFGLLGWKPVKRGLVEKPDVIAQRKPLEVEHLPPSPGFRKFSVNSQFLLLVPRINDPKNSKTHDQV